MTAKKKNYTSVNVDSEFGNNFLDLSKLFSKKKGKSKKSEEKSSSSILFKVFLGIAILALLLILIIGGFSFGFLINLILWSGLLYIIKKGLFFGTGVLVIIGTVLLIVSFFTMGAVGDDQAASTNCNIGDLEKYDGKTIDVTGDNIQGKLIFEKRCGDEPYASIKFRFIVNDNWDTNCKEIKEEECSQMCFEDRAFYHYIINIPGTDYTTAAIKIPCEMNEVPGFEEKLGCDNPDWTKETTYFSIEGSTHVVTYDDLMAFNTFDVLDSLDYYEVIDKSNDQISCSANTEKMLANEGVYRSYTWEYTDMDIQEDEISDLSDCKSIAAQNNIPSIEFEINNFDERIKKLRLGERTEYTYMSQHDDCEESLDKCINDAYTDLDNCRYNGGTECDIDYSVQRERCTLPVLKCELEMWQKEC